MDEYKRIVITGFKQRELQRLGGVIIDYAGKYSNPDEIISEVTKRLDRLVVNSSIGDVIQLGDVLDDLFTSLENRKQNKDSGGITTGFPKLDLFTTGYRPGEVWLFGARPSMGKTTFLYNSFLNVAKKGYGTLIINREMSIHSILERFYAMESKVPLLNIRNGDLTDAQYEKLRSAKEVLKDLPIHIDNSWISDDNFITATIRKYQRTKDIKVVGLDYIQLLTERSADSTHELGRISRNLKLLSGELGITSVILSQLNREVEKRDDKRPLMSDLRQSGNLEEDADYMIALYRDDVYVMNSRKAGVLEAIIRKARNGPTGICEFKFDGSIVSIIDPSGGMNFNDESKQTKGQRKSLGT
jgi:replicative DNA helicase